MSLSHSPGFRSAVRPERMRLVVLAAAVTVASVLPALGQERLCDTQFEDCRTPLQTYIQQETVGIDVALWFIQDGNYVNWLIDRHNAGVPVRVIVDQRANTSKDRNELLINQMCAAGIPMREKFAGADILHFKMMLFDGQDVVEFSKANFTSESFVPDEPNVNYFDEAIYFTSDDNLTNSFRRRFDDLWVDTTDFRNYSDNHETCAWNGGKTVRKWADAAGNPTVFIHKSMNFVPLDNFADRSVSRYNEEIQGIDAIVYRVMDARHSDALIRAVVERGVPVRLITDSGEYRNKLRLWDAEEVDRMFMAGVKIKIGQHAGIVHEGAVVLHGLGEVIFGSSNWTVASAQYEDEHNYFYEPSLGNQPFFQWFADQFTGKWNDSKNYADFVPLPPDAPMYSSPAYGASGVSSSVTLTWDGGTWAHLYDIYFGTTPDPPRIETDLQLGSPVEGTLETYTVTNLEPGTQYYWRIVSKTRAQQSASGSIWSFTTSGTTPPPPPILSAPYGGVPWAVPGTFQAENFDDGGTNVAYYDTTTGNKGAAYRSTDVDIGPTTDDSGSYIGWTRAGEWLMYTVNVASTGTYTLDTRLANVGTGAIFHLELDAVDATGPIVVPDTGAWNAWQTISTSGIALATGQHVIRVVLDKIGSGGGVGNFNWFRLSADTTPPPPALNTPYGGRAPWPVPGTLQAEDFDDGGQAIAYYDTTTVNKGGEYRQTGVDIGPTTDEGAGGYYVGWTRAGEWLKYTVNIASAGTYSLEMRVASIGTDATVHVEVDGVPTTGAIALPDTQAWDVFETIATTGLSLPAGQHVITICFDTIATGGGVGNLNWFRLTRTN